MHVGWGSSPGLSPAGPLTVKYVFDYAAISVQTFRGWMVILTFLSSALAGALGLYIVVERTKKCLDFTATLYVIHLFCCVFYKGIPSTMEWWITIGTSVLAMTVLGEWMCMRKEMRDIPLSGATSRPSRSHLPIATSERPARRGVDNNRMGLFRFLSG
mmetsp:Transcript_15748/g.40147  ORF Transcript_15748/g.40147 Transcript_15748/m.40147 type:complete len:158 (+) Transcript_15748:286-759(+)